MENNFELEEMKQQWSTLQTALNNQKEVNIKLILRDATKRVSWNSSFLKVVSFVTMLLTVPYCLFALPYYGVPQPICITLTALFIVITFNAFYMSRLVQTPNNSNLDMLQYSKALIKFKKHYLRSKIFGISSLIALIIWIVTYMGLDMTNPMVISAIIGGTIGAIIGISLNFRVLSNIRELQNDIDLIENLEK
ncbi:MAG: hypothetical protein SNF69_05455 [Rikenellaceae bacterium]